MSLATRKVEKHALVRVPREVVTTCRGHWGEGDSVQGAKGGRETEALGQRLLN